MWPSSEAAANRASEAFLLSLSVKTTEWIYKNFPYEMPPLTKSHLLSELT
jgi:hypothetical protein